MKLIMDTLKVVIVVIAGALLIAAIAFTCIGIYAEATNLIQLFNPEADLRKEALLKLLEVVDLFLIALVLFILAIGLAQLFLGQHISQFSTKLEWLHFHNFTELKLVLWKMILTTILISFFVELYEQKNHPHWNILIFPASIFLITVSLFMLKDKKNEPPE